MIAIDACVLPVASARGCEPRHVLFHPTVSTYTQYTYIHTYIHTYTIHRTGRGKTGYYDSNRVERIKLVENNLSKVYPFIFDRKINIKIFRSDFSEFSVPSWLTDLRCVQRCDEETEIRTGTTETLVHRKLIRRPKKRKGNIYIYIGESRRGNDLSVFHREEGKGWEGGGGPRSRSTRSPPHGSHWSVSYTYRVG